MAGGTKILQSIEKALATKSRLFLKNALVVSHLQYISKILSGITTKLTKSFEKHLSWATKTCCNRKEISSSSDLNLIHKILPTSRFLNWKSLSYLWTIKHKILRSY